MRIVEPAPEFWYATCSECTAVVEYKLNELTDAYNKYINCPECAHKMWHSTTNTRRRSLWNLLKAL